MPIGIKLAILKPILWFIDKLYWNIKIKFLLVDNCAGSVIPVQMSIVFGEGIEIAEDRKKIKINV